jgi:N-methylhydantoinase A/oxoprolinase/acetone carboxylase beta subunit
VGWVIFRELGRGLVTVAEAYAADTLEAYLHAIESKVASKIEAIRYLNAQ